MEEMAPSVEPATSIGNVEGGGSEAAPTMEDLASLGEPATNMCRVRGGGLNAVTSTETIQSNLGGNIAGKSTEKLSIMSNPDSPYIIGSNCAATILNEIGLAEYTDCNQEHLSTSKISVTEEKCAGESKRSQTPAENDPKSLRSNFKSSNFDLKHDSYSHTAMDSLIKDMSLNSISPTSACSSSDGNCIVEEDLIAVWKNVLGEFIYDQHFKNEVDTVYCENENLGVISGDVYKNNLHKKPYKRMTAVERIYTQVPLDL
jgi:hypothetical protein